MTVAEGPGGRASRHPILAAAAFAGAYASVIGLASVPGAIWRRGWIDRDLAVALLLIAAGAAVAGFLTALVFRLRRARRGFSARFAAAIFLLIVLTAGFDALFLYLDYIAYYTQWWPEPFSVHWFFTAATTFVGVFFYYAAVAVPMLLPLGLPAVFGFAFFLARR